MVFAPDLVAPQGTGPGSGITVKPQTIAPTVVPLDGTCLVILLLPSAPREVGIQVRKIGLGQLFFQVLKREKEHGAVALSRDGGHRRQQKGESERHEEWFPESPA